VYLFSICCTESHIYLYFIITNLGLFRSRIKPQPRNRSRNICRNGACCSVLFSNQFICVAEVRSAVHNCLVFRDLGVDDGVVTATIVLIVAAGPCGLLVTICIVRSLGSSRLPTPVSRSPFTRPALFRRRFIPHPFYR